MSRFRIIFANLIVIVFLLTASCVPRERDKTPTSTTPAAILPAKAEWEKNWEKIVAETKKENKVVVWATGGSWAPARPLMAETLKRKYGIDLEMVIAPSLMLNERLFRERKAGIYDVDIFFASSPGVPPLKRADVLDQVEPALILPEVIDPRAWMGGGLFWIDPEHNLLVFGGGTGPYILINTNLVKPDEIKSMTDFLNPKWKGKIVIHDPTVQGPGRSQIMVMGTGELGWDFVRELLKQEPIITIDSHLNVDWIARGVYPILLGFSSGTVGDYKKAGAPIKVIPPPKEAVFYAAFASILTLIKNAPHPNSAKLFINWLLTKEVQTLITGPLNTPSRRLDVPNKELVDPALVPEPEVKYRMIDHPDEVARYDEYQKKINEIFLPYIRK